MLKMNPGANVSPYHDQVVARNASQEHYRKICIGKHYQKLENLKKIDLNSIKVNFQKEENFQEGLRLAHKKNITFQRYQKDLKINRENQKIMSKLIEIQRGKLLNVPKATSPQNSLYYDNIALKSVDYNPVKIERSFRNNSMMELSQRTGKR